MIYVTKKTANALKKIGCFAQKMIEPKLKTESFEGPDSLDKTFKKTQSF